MNNPNMNSCLFSKIFLNMYNIFLKFRTFCVLYISEFDLYAYLEKYY